MAAAVDLASVREARVCPAARAASRCEALARGGGATRRALARAAGRFVRIRGWERLGFARLGDYAVERLGVSARELQDLARVDAALGSLLRLSAALAEGRLAWTKVRLLARVATPEDEARWLGVAKALSARDLAREVRRMDVGSVEAGVRIGDADDVRRETLQLRCAPHTRAKWHRARVLSCRVAGQRLVAWQSAEAVAAEVLSALPLEGAEAEALASLPGVGSVRPGSALAGPPTARALPRAERRERTHCETADGPDAFACDARLRAGIAREQRAEAALAEALLAAAERRGHRARGFATLDAYARDALGISPRKARMLLRLARAARRVPALGAAWRAGALSFLRAYALVPVVLAAPAHAAGWIARARRVPCLRLEDEVAEALVAAETDPAGFAAGGGLPDPGAADETDGASGVGVVGGAAEAPVRRQPGAQATVPARETARLMINGPHDVMRLFRATLCTVRRRLERRTGRCPTPGETFDAMLDHAFAAWLTTEKRRGRRAQRVFERDGWRCTAPACSSYRNLQDHHVVFRSRGGSNALSNRTTLCAWHHLRGVHAGRVRCTGTAPDALRFELGLRPGRTPLLASPGQGQGQGQGQLSRPAPSPRPPTSPGPGRGCG